ncbi:hypothetical protein IGJ28_000755 [Enterococcus sp. AZ091]|uniref:hypothetical protein n=1 Tax=Enterococcus sp. AZ091 TaxID=2774720 RepID=UPI003F29D110
MIISLEEAQVIYPDITQAYLDGIEQSIRAETNNNFQNQTIRFLGIDFISDNMIVVDELEGLSVGDTIQVSGSKWNNGLYVITGIDDNVLTVQDNARLFTGHDEAAFITKIEYPSDILLGVMKLLKYDAKTANTIGLKSKTVSRMSETYFDQNSAEMIAGYPAALMSFIDKYRKMRW